MTLDLAELFERYGSAVIYVAVENEDGSHGIGAAFHIGEGVYITARHVVGGKRVLEVGFTMPHFRIPDPKGNVTVHGRKGRYRTIDTGTWRVTRGPFFHPNEAVDIAAFVCDRSDCAVVPLGTHLDDWIGVRDFILRDVVIMGYPPVPLSRTPTLIAAKAEVNATVDQYVAPHPHFIVSAMARGGFSGGLCMVEHEFALGVVTEALVYDARPAELGFMAVLTVEPIYVCLDENKILPKCQWDGELDWKPPPNPWVQIDRSRRRRGRS